MKIAFIVRGFFKAGGISRYVVELADLSVRDHEVHIFAAKIDRTLVPGAIYHQVPMFSSRFLKQHKWFALNNLLEVFTFMICSRWMVHASDFSVVHTQGDYIGPAHVYTAHSCHKAWLRLYRAGKHGLIGYLRKSPVNPLHMVVLFIEKISVTRSRRVIAISEGTKQELIACYGVPAGKIDVIPNGVNTAEFGAAGKEEARTRIRNLYGIWREDIVVLFPAHEFHRKGLGELIRAIGGIKDAPVKVLVVGRDDPHPFRSLADREGCADRVFFAGAATRMSDFYHASDMLVFPTVYEPFGLIITEAMASGVPPVVSRIAGAAELITDGIDGVLINDPSDVAEIRRHIRALCHDAAARAAMAAAARRTAMKYSWQNIAELTMAAYAKEKD